MLNQHPKQTLVITHLHFKFFNYNALATLAINFGDKHKCNLHKYCQINLMIM